MITRNRKLLAVEVAGDDIRAALVRRVGKTFEVVDFAAIPRPDLNDDLPPVAAIRALAERLQHQGGGVVFVSPMARTFDLLMDRVKIKGLKKRQMLEAVKWEVEPYTGISGSNALIGVERVRATAPAAGDVQPDDEEAPVTVNVSAMERNVYRALKARFRVAGFKLLRVYPPDVTFYMPLLVQAAEAPRAVLDVGPDYSNFAVLRGRTAEQISTLSLSLEALSAHLIGEELSADLQDSLRFNARQVPPPEPLVVSGVGAGLPAVVDYIAGFCPHGAVPLTLSRSAGIADTRDDPANAVYATVAGAAIRELQGSAEQALGLSDAVDPGQRLRKSAYMVPLVASVATSLVLFGHFGYMKYQENAYNRRIEELNGEIKTIKARVAESDGLIKQSGELREKLALARRKFEFLTTEGDREITRLIDGLGGLAAALTDSIILTKVVVEPAGDYLLTGTTFDAHGFGRYLTGLQAQPAFQTSTLRILKRPDAPGAPLQFEVRLTPRPEGE